MRTVRHEVLDLTLVLGRRHLDRLLAAYECHYNSQRPHRGLDLKVPECLHPVAPVDEVPRIERHDVLGGLIHEYHAVPDWWIAVLAPLTRGEPKNACSWREAAASIRALAIAIPTIAPISMAHSRVCPLLMIRRQLGVRAIELVEVGTGGRAYPRSPLRSAGNAPIA